jgi:hypothetical protein
MSTYLKQENFVFFFEWQREAVDDGTEDLEEFRDAVVTLSLVHEPVKDVVDLTTKSQNLFVVVAEDLFRARTFSLVLCLRARQDTIIRGLYHKTYYGRNLRFP